MVDQTLLPTLADLLISTAWQHYWKECTTRDRKLRATHAHVFHARLSDMVYLTTSILLQYGTLLLYFSTTLL